MPSADECRRHPRACGGKRSQKSEKAALLAPAERTESGCPRRRWETLFASIIGGLLRENSIPPGAIMDAGANTGTEACYFALHAPDRTVYALDPVPANVRHMERHYGGSFPNLMPKVGALGERPGTMQGVSVAARKNARSNDVVGGDQVTDLFAQVRHDGDESRRTGHAGRRAGGSSVVRSSPTRHWIRALGRGGLGVGGARAHVAPSETCPYSPSRRSCTRVRKRPSDSSRSCVATSRGSSTRSVATRWIVGT